MVSHQYPTLNISIPPGITLPTPLGGTPFVLVGYLVPHCSIYLLCFAPYREPHWFLGSQHPAGSLTNSAQEETKMATANSRMTLGSILGAIQTTANTVTASLNAVNEGVGMVNKTVSNAAQRQEVRSKLDSAIFEKTLHQEKAMELTESRMVIRDYRKKSDDHSSMYETAYSELHELLKS